MQHVLLHVHVQCITVFKDDAISIIEANYQIDGDAAKCLHNTSDRKHQPQKAGI